MGQTLPGRADVGTAEDLHASATKVTGLSDFGADEYREGLAVLLDSYARDAALTPFGNKVTRSMLRGALVARLLSEAAWQQYPQHADVAIERPIFVTGLPRTGTTYGAAEQVTALLGSELNPAMMLNVTNVR